MVRSGPPAQAGRDGEEGARRERIGAIFRHGLEGQRRACDPLRHLVGAPGVGGSTVYRPAVSLWLAHALLRQAGGGEGDPGDAQEAADIVAAVLASQERAPAHPHRGNFLWLAGDDEVVDLNAVQFVLRALLPLLVEHGDRLPDDLVARGREALRLALEEQERMAVAPTYTNIHVMSLFSLLVGAEWLGDAHFLALGRARWDAWVAFTAGSGAPHEYNSPGYDAVDPGALAALQQYVRDPQVKLQARLFYERVWLHYARPGASAPWGMLYSRYVVNDRHYGTISAAPDRPPNAFYDQGHFGAVQQRNKAIALYALQAQYEEVSSLKTVVALRLARPAAGLDEVWLGGRRVGAGDLPLHVAPGEWLVVADGAVYAGVRPLQPPSRTGCWRRSSIPRRGPGWPLTPRTRRPRCAWRRRSAPSARRAGGWGAWSGGRPPGEPRPSCWTRWRSRRSCACPRGCG
jgi:hypothetical protein